MLEGWEGSTLDKSDDLAVVERAHWSRPGVKVARPVTPRYWVARWEEGS